MGGISLLLLERDMPGIKVRKMETQFDTSHSTCMVTLEGGCARHAPRHSHPESADVRVPVRNLIGQENQGFMLIMLNFNHERFMLAVSTSRGAREWQEESRSPPPPSLN